jgi:hypothetical protein
MSMKMLLRTYAFICSYTNFRILLYYTILSFYIKYFVLIQATYIFTQNFENMSLFYVALKVLQTYLACILGRM